MYNPTKWLDHIVDTENEFILEHIEGNRYKVIESGKVIQKGTKLSAENLNKHEIATFELSVAFSSLLQENMLLRDELKKHLSSSFVYLTDEITYNNSTFLGTNGYIYLTNTSSVSFPDEHIRKNTDYTVIPIITKITMAEGGDPSTYCGTPLFLITNKEIGKFNIEAFRPDPDYQIAEWSVKFVVIGGI